MQIIKSLVFTVDGRIDSITSMQLKSEIVKTAQGVDELIFDFKNLLYISSAGLRVLLETHKAMTEKGISMKIANASPSVMKVFEISGFDKILAFI